MIEQRKFLPMHDAFALCQEKDCNSGFTKKTKTL